MLVLVKWLHLMALIVWVGEVIFFSFVVAPGVFRALPPPALEAGRVLNEIFPTYYKIGSASGVVLLVTTLVLLAAAPARTGLGIGAVVVGAMLAATLYAGVIVLPRATELRPQIHDASAPAGAKEEFDRLHRLAVQLNGAVLLGGVVVSLITATTLRP